MKKFRKIVELGPVGLEAWAEDRLDTLCEERIAYQEVPMDKEEIIEKIGDADAVLLRMTPHLSKEILAECKELSYVGLCCSLYSKESANVDIPYARENGISVTGIRDYGDHGVTEYVIYQLVRILHGYDFPMWKKRPMEIGSLKVGFLGMGVPAGMTADALAFLGADVSYFARSVKEDRKNRGMHYKELHTLLRESDVVISCLHRNVVLLDEEAFKALGNKKILINTSIAPTFEEEALAKWLENSENIFACDMTEGLGSLADREREFQNIICQHRSSGMTEQSYERLSQKVLANIEEYLGRK